MTLTALNNVFFSLRKRRGAGSKKMVRNGSTFSQNSVALFFVGAHSIASMKLDISLHQGGSKCQNAPPIPWYLAASRGLTNQVIKRRCWRRCPLPRLDKRRSPLTFPRACRGILRSRRSDGAGKPTLSSVQLERKGAGSGGQGPSRLRLAAAHTPILDHLTPGGLIPHLLLWGWGARSN